MLSGGVKFVKRFTRRGGIHAVRDDKDLLSGVNPILEKLKTAPEEIIEIMIMQSPRSSTLQEVEVESRRLGITLHYRSRRFLDALAQSRKHQGILAWVQPYSYLPFSDLEECLKKSPGADWVLVLDNVTDPRNFGALLRTAEAVGIRDIVIPKDRSVRITPVVAKASAGAVNYLRICQVTNLRRALRALKHQGLWVVGLEATSPISYHNRKYPTRVAVVVGSEGRGLRPLVQRECDFLVSIPMRGKISSLNVSVAGAVFLYELLRQRSSIDKDDAKS